MVRLGPYREFIRLLTQRNMENDMSELTPHTDTAAGQDLALLSEMNTQYARIAGAMMKGQDHSDLAMYSLSIATLFAKAAAGNAMRMNDVLDIQTQAMKKFASLADYTLKRMQHETTEPVVAPADDDMRFRSSSWSENLWFDVLKQSYLINSEYLDNLFSKDTNLERQDQRKLEFFKKQWIDALAPTNFALTNPDVVAQAKETGGRSLVEGLRNFADDLESGAGVSMVDKASFEMGQNIASTPGKVVARNRLAELIQYSPATQQVYAKPIMIVPPWINKYYILDLSPKNSFIGWLVSQGYTVFVISWVNPDESYRHTNYDDYLSLGPLWASNVIRSVTGEEKINAIGYCLGGTLLASLLGYLASNDEQPDFISSATFFTTMIDFEEPGDLGVFVDEESVSQLETKMNERGYLDGSSMASTFNMMRSNDLIWHFVINNYLLGKKPGRFDLLYWNSDSTRMPADMHSYYLRQMYLENLLCKPNGMTILDTAIDLAKVKTPAFFIATQLDHIAPWKSTYSGARLFSGNTRFLLGESGHIAGIINSPERKKYGYWSSAKKLPDSADEWLKVARRRDGSWWPEWEKWARKFSGDQIDARQPGSDDHPPLADAPGDYVRM